MTKLLFYISLGVLFLTVQAWAQVTPSPNNVTGGSSNSAPNVSIATGTLPVANGGTGQTVNANVVLLQKAALAANGFNLVRNGVQSNTTVTIGTAAPSLTGFTSLTQSSGFALPSFTGNTTNGSNVITNLSTTTGLVVGMPVLETQSNGAYPANVPLGNYITSINAGASTLTMLKPATATTAGVTLYVASDLINYIGGVPATYNANLMIAGNTTGNFVNPPTAQFTTPEGGAIEFMTDAANFVSSGNAVILKMYQNSAAGSPQSVRVGVDGFYQNQPVSCGAGTGGTTCYLSIAFNTQSAHIVRIEWSQLMAINNLYVLTGASIWKPTYPYPVSCGIYGDSFESSGSAVSFPMRNLAVQTALLLGCQPDIISVAGTGYVANGNVNYNFASPFRTRDAALKPYNVIMVGPASVNDAGDNTQANVLTTLQGLRANAPNAFIIVFGVPTTVNLNQAGATTLENYIIAAYAQWGDANSVFIPVTTDPDGAWVNTNNTGVYVYSDGTHPTDPLGTNYYAYKMAMKVRNAIGVGSF